MNCLQILPRFSTLTSQGPRDNGRKLTTFSVTTMARSRHFHFRPNTVSMALSGGASNAEMRSPELKEEKSEIYSTNMTQAMGAVLTYRHELGMNYNFILPDLIVGSCLQAPEDVDKLRTVGVKTIFCLQQDSDLEYFGVDIAAIREYAKKCEDIEHIRAEIRDEAEVTAISMLVMYGSLGDFDAFDLRMRLPSVVSKLYKAINRNQGVTYIHCTAGLGRAPAVALAYMFWILGYKLSEANQLLQSKRPCFPKLAAITSATADILTGLEKTPVTLTWKGDRFSSVEVSGLDIGWGQRIPLKFDKEKGSWILERELPLPNPLVVAGLDTDLYVKPLVHNSIAKPEHVEQMRKISKNIIEEKEGHYEYKYIVDGEWLCNKNEFVTQPNKDGHVNNYVHVNSVDSTGVTREYRKQLMDDDADLTEEEQLKIKQFLEAYVDEELSGV